jgi:serine protease inhibitor
VRLDCAQELPVDPAWIGSLSTNFQAHFERQDFVSDARGATERIDAWFEKETRGRVPNLYGHNVLPKTSTLVASSILTFRKDWAEKFSLFETESRPFILEGGQSVSVPTMRAKRLPISTTRVRDAGADGSRGAGLPGPLWVALPFDGESTYLLLGLPATTGELPAMEQQLSDPGVHAIFNQMGAGQPEVFLPKIDWLTPTFSLTSPIQKLPGGHELAELDLWNCLVSPDGC